MRGLNFTAGHPIVVEKQTHFSPSPGHHSHQSTWGLLEVTLKPQPVQMLSRQLHCFPFSGYFSLSSKSVQHTSASQSSWVWSALLKVMLTVSVKGGDSMSPSFPALWFSSLSGDLNWWLPSFNSSVLKTCAAAVTLQNAEVGYKKEGDRLIWTAEVKAFSLHHHHCLFVSRFQFTTNSKRQHLAIRVMRMIAFGHLYLGSYHPLA